MDNYFKVAVIGVGSMGSKYALLLQQGAVAGARLAALTRVRSPYREQLEPCIAAGVPAHLQRLIAESRSAR